MRTIRRPVQLLLALFTAVSLTFGAATVMAASEGPCVGAAVIGTCSSTPGCQADCEDAGGYEGICDQGGCCHCAF
ncbi:MAG TPA: hypothetical protein VM759_00285 [Longimicrobium sp.]|nr:hypothetical protein [Longimicrobium sp.]